MVGGWVLQLGVVVPWLFMENVTRRHEHDAIKIESSKKNLLPIPLKHQSRSLLGLKTY